MKKRLISLLLAVFVLAVTNIQTAAVYAESMILPETWGTVTAFSDGLLHVLGVSMSDTGMDEVILSVEDAEIFDLMTGYTATERDITEDMTVRAVYNPEFSRDEPPRGAALSIYLNAGQDGAAAFRAVASDNIQYDEDECTFVTDDGKYRFTLSSDTEVMDENGKYISPEEIEPGMEMFVWVDLVTASFPGQAYPEKVVLIDSVLRDDYENETLSDGTDAEDDRIYEDTNVKYAPFDYQDEMYPTQADNDILFVDNK